MAHSSRVPGYARLLIIVQTIVIVYFVFWTFEEYANNYYFQSYVNSTLQTGGFAIVALSIVGVFTAVATGLYMKLKQTRRELLHLTTMEESPAQTPASGSILAPHEEQHLINMIRKSTSTESTSMPVLNREEPSGQAK